MNKKRKLRAILFADIVGYTALMQKDEAKASLLLQKFRNTLNEKVTQYSGEIINNYGDGCLCTFESAVDAITCAKEVQLIFQTEPKVPVRIGLHSGDVFFEDNNVFGDSVNIASRIESLGVAGAVLFSKRVKRDITNHKVFEVQSLGNFDFKNVEKSMEIFALANEGLVIPKRSQIQGKLKPQKNKWIIPFVILGMLAIVFGVWKTTTNGTDSKRNASNETVETPISEEYRQKRVAVMVFDNKTGRDNLADFGVMISDWITKGLMETGEAKIISAANISAQIKEAGTNTAELAKTTGVGVILQGRYYFQENQLIIHANIVDAIKGEVIYALDPIQGQEDKMLNLLDELTQEVLGYWATKGQKKFMANPPKYEAFQAYLKGEDLHNKNPQQSEQYLKQAFQLDKTFYIPILKLASLYNNIFQYEKYDSTINLIQQFYPNFTEWEKLRYESLQYNMVDWDKSFTVNSRLFELDPSNLVPFNNAAQSLIKANKPQQALEFIKAMKARYPLSNPKFSKAISHNSIKAHFFLKDYKAVVKLAEKALKQGQEIFETYPPLHLKSLIRLNQFEVIDGVLANYEKKDIYSYNSGFFKNKKAFLLKIVCEELALMEHKDLLLKYGNQLRRWAINHSEGNELSFDMGYVHWCLEDYAQALIWWEKEQYAKNNLAQKLYKHVRMGVCYAKLNQTEAALAEIKKIQLLPEPGITLKNTKNSCIAAIQANLNQKEEAVAFLKLALEGGIHYEPFFISNTFVFPFKNNLALKPLFGYPPFEELVKPKE